MGDRIEIIAIEFIDSINAYQVDLCNETKGEYYRVFIPNEYIEQAKAEDETKQEKSIQMAQQNQEYRERKIKQAKIDVLNELKERIKTAIGTYFNLDGGGYYLAEGAIDDIDELINEVQNEN